MRHQEFYRRYKATYKPITNPIFFKANWRLNVVVTALAILIEPLIAYKYNRHIPFSLDYYLQQIKYFLPISVPLGVFLLWISWRELVKQSRGYIWIGKFEVMSKQIAFLYCYLILAPGEGNKLRVDRVLFEKIKVGDFITIRRDSFGHIDEVSKVKKSSTYLVRVRSNRFSKPAGKVVNVRSPDDD